MEWGDGSQDAHQVVRTSCSRAPRRSAGDPHPSQKNSHGILPRLLPSAVPAASREVRSAPRRNSGPTLRLRATPLLERPCTPAHAGRHEQTPVTPRTLRETCSFCGFGMGCGQRARRQSAGAGIASGAGESPVRRKRPRSATQFVYLSRGAGTRSAGSRIRRCGRPAFRCCGDSAGGRHPFPKTRMAPAAFDLPLVPRTSRGSSIAAPGVGGRALSRSAPSRRPS